MAFYSHPCLTILKFLSCLSPPLDWSILKRGAKSYLFLELSHLEHSQQPGWRAQYMLNEWIGGWDSSIDHQWLTEWLAYESRESDADVRNRGVSFRRARRKLVHHLRAQDFESKSNFKFCLCSLLWPSDHKPWFPDLGKLGVIIPATGLLCRLSER